MQSPLHPSQSPGAQQIALQTPLLPHQSDNANGLHCVLGHRERKPVLYETYNI
jgi:hypothetical protein